MAWTRGERLQVISIAVAVVGIVVAYVEGVSPQKIGCWTHLSSCAATAGASAPGMQLPVTPTSVAPTNVDEAVPYYVPEPQAHAVSSSQAPVIGLDVTSIDNQGKPVVLNLSGSGFFAYSTAKVMWYTPRGTVYQSLIVPTDDRGLMQVALLWTPVPSLGVAGNDGAWKISAVDQVSGQEADQQLDVSSNTGTPSPSTWAANDAPGAAGPPTINAGTSGYLCQGPGAWSVVDLQGFRPGASIEMAFYNGSGGRVLLVEGLRADALGNVNNILDFWKIRGCSSTESFNYTVVAAAVGQRAQAEILLTTR